MSHYLRYRNFATEQKPKAPEAETKEQRIARVLRTMPASMFNNPELRMKALKKAALIMACFSLCSCSLALDQQRGGGREVREQAW